MVLYRENSSTSIRVRAEMRIKEKERKRGSTARGSVFACNATAEKGARQRVRDFVIRGNEEPLVHRLDYAGKRESHTARLIRSPAHSTRRCSSSLSNRVRRPCRSRRATFQFSRV